MHSRDAVFLEDLCPKLRTRRWRQSIHLHTGKRCIYCGKPSESIDHVFPLSRGGMSVTENCVPLACPATDASLIRMFLSGTGANLFTTLAAPWPSAPGLTAIFALPCDCCNGPSLNTTTQPTPKGQRTLTPMGMTSRTGDFVQPDHHTRQAASE